jgi:hypothetical protein
MINLCTYRSLVTLDELGQDVLHGRPLMRFTMHADHTKFEQGKEVTQVSWVTDMLTDDVDV